MDLASVFFAQLGDANKNSLQERESMSISVEVRGDLEKAIRFFKKQLQKDGILKECKKRQFYLKPSVKKKHKRLAAERRRRSDARRSLYTER